MSRTARCTASVSRALSDPAGGPATATWLIDYLVTESAVYDIWVRVPPGTSGRDTAALFIVETAHGPDYAEVDLSDAAGGWVKLTGTLFGEFKLDRAADVTLELVNGQNGTVLAVDAIVVDRQQLPQH